MVYKWRTGWIGHVCSGIGCWDQQWCGLMPAFLCVSPSVYLFLFTLLSRSLRHGWSTSESLYSEEMVIASSLQPSEWPDLTGSLLQPLWLSVLFSHSHSPRFVFKAPPTFPKQLDRLIVRCKSAMLFFYLVCVNEVFFLPGASSKINILNSIWKNSSSVSQFDVLW